MTRDQLIEHASNRPAMVLVCEPRVEAALAELQPNGAGPSHPRRRPQHRCREMAVASI